MASQDKSDKIQKGLAIKERLPNTWTAFFSRFGRLLPVQIEVIPKLLDNKKNLVLCSPSASGKTEAVVAPLAELLLSSSEPVKGLRIVYVTPTRPLANDL